MVHMKRLLASAAAIALAASCGGKSQIDETGGAGGLGGASGSGGAGGSVGGSGGTGGSVGGSTAVGGSAGFGGTVGGSAGFGGTVGGSAGAGGSGGVSSLIDQLCMELSTIPCGMPYATCVAELNEGLKLADSFGCQNIYLNLLECANQFGFTCQPGENDPVVHPSCEPLVDQFQQCVQGGECGYSVGPGFCSVDCPGWSANCKEQGKTLLCVCSDGVQFATPGACTGGWAEIAEANCGP
jgi:hypothetical protein